MSAFSSAETPESNIGNVRRKMESLKESLWLAGEHDPHALDRYALRIAKKEDSERLAELYRESFPEYPYRQLHMEEYHLHCAEDPNTVRVVEEIDGYIIGAAALALISPCLLGELKQVVVDPKYRGKGLTTHLVRTSTEIAERLGLEKVYSEARTRMPAMQKSLLKCGYEPIAIEYGQYIVYHADGPVRENMVLMVRYLNCGERRIDEKDEIIQDIIEKLMEGTSPRRSKMRKGG